EAVDVVHVHHSHDHWLGWLGRGRAGLVRTFHNARAVRLSWPSPWLYRRTDALIAVSREIEERGRRAGIPADRLAHAAQVGERVERIAAHLEREARQGLEARLARLLLEPVPRDEPEQHAVATRAETGQQPDDRLRAAGPPAIGHQVENGERLLAHASSSA
ncbi:MAG TPA: glycosyltransferase, partial [Verrucomicrobiae bacterium]|nr:glycosyltransferase [Verrucomicrobiae bacterium]